MNRILRLAGLATFGMVATASAQQSINLAGKPLAATTEGLTRIYGARELPGNRVLVTDNNEYRLVLVDFATNRMTDVGHKGDGPNEYRGVSDLYLAPNNGTLMAIGGNVFFISADPKITDKFREPGSETSFLPQRSIGTDAAGNMYYLRSRYGDDSGTIVRWKPKAPSVDTLLKVAAPKMQVGTVDGNNRLRLAEGSAKPFDPADYWVPLPDGRLAIVRATPFRIDFLTGRQLLRGPIVPYTPIRLTAADRDAYRLEKSKEKIANAGNAPPGQGAPRPRIADEDFALVKPPFMGQTAIEVSPEGEIWVLRTRVDKDSIPTYDIFDGTGKVIGKATLKPHSRVVAFGAGTVYVARQNPDDDLLYLEKYSRK